MARLPYTVICPTCGAPGGWPCKQPGGGFLVGKHHDARINFAKA